MLTLALTAAAREAVANPAQERADAIAGNPMAGPPTDELVSTFARELPRFLAAVWRVFNEYELAGYVAMQKPAVRRQLRTLLYFS